jgi:hypothetical protein
MPRERDSFRSWAEGIGPSARVVWRKSRASSSWERRRASSEMVGTLARDWEGGRGVGSHRRCGEEAAGIAIRGLGGVGAFDVRSWGPSVCGAFTAAAVAAGLVVMVKAREGLLGPRLFFSWWRWRRVGLWGSWSRRRTERARAV